MRLRKRENQALIKISIILKFSGLDILVLLCVLQLLLSQICAELLCNEWRLCTRNPLVLLLLQKWDGELSATSSVFHLGSQIPLSVDLLVSQSCLEDTISRPHRSSWSFLHPELLVYTSILSAPYLECPHWKKMELLHVLAVLNLKYSYYMNHLEDLELHLVHFNL